MRSRGVRIAGVTIIPRHNRAPTESNSGWNPAKTQVRHEVNQWLRTTAAFDAVVDFDRAVQAPENADRLHPPFDCGDGIHPSPRGYYEMGGSLPIDLLR